VKPADLHRPSGFTLVEAVVALTVFLLVMGGAFSVLGSSQGLLVLESATAEQETTARRVLGRLGEDFRMGIRSTLIPAAPSLSPAASAVQTKGYANGQVVEGPRVGYERRADPADPPNGKDDDRDGFIDEGTVVRTAGGTEVVIAENVKDLLFTLVGSRLECSITVERTVRGGQTLAFTDAVRCRLRN
jgi:type II secretory pathway pseudopilin PulG